MNAEIRVIKSVFCKDFEILKLFFLEKGPSTHLRVVVLAPVIQYHPPAASSGPELGQELGQEAWTNFSRVFLFTCPSSWTSGSARGKHVIESSLSKFLSKFGSRGWLGKNGPTSHTVVRKEKLARSTQTKQNHAKSCHIKNRAKTG